MIFVLDNYDSFTYNLVQRLGEIDPSLEIVVKRNDQTSLEEIAELNPERIIISPGPCTPKEAGLSCEIIHEFGPKLPLLGVCLGHQSIADVYGAKVVRADRLMHGKVSRIRHDEQGVFAGIENPSIATRYHSLIVPQESLPDCLIPTAWSADEDYPAELMGLRHRDFPIHGVQFHPESFLTEAGTVLLKNFLNLAA
ncbi:anthranilate synthase component II [Rubinisphaera italica]|nr:aminodeoxychorismate/anthranilate synthase component II [Rubinisphaera italica]